MRKIVSWSSPDMRRLTYPGTRTQLCLCVYALAPAIGTIPLAYHLAERLKARVGVIIPLASSSAVSAEARAQILVRRIDQCLRQTDVARFGYDVVSPA